MKQYRAVVIGCSRMGAFIDNEVADTAWITKPYSHAAGYEACSRTDLVACSDLRPEVMKQVGDRYGVPKERQYTDFRRLFEEIEPEIVSVATQPEHRAEIVIYAAEHGAKAIYAEKAMASSMQEADAMVEAVERNGVAFNLGTNRRWAPGYDKMKEVIDSGQLGPLKTITAYNNSRLFNIGSHNFDLFMRINNDHSASWVQAHLPDGDDVLDGEILREDPLGHGMIQFENGVTGYALLTRRHGVFEVTCERGVITSMPGETGFELSQEGGRDSRGRAKLEPGTFPTFKNGSSTLKLIEDLVQAVDTGRPTRGGGRMARANTELIMAFVESHRRGGARVTLPLRDCKLKLQRHWAPRQPKYRI